MKEGFDPNKIDEILTKTLKSIDEGRDNIFDIAETARKEYDNVKNELEEIKEKTSEVIDEVDKLETESKKARQKLAMVSKNFYKYSEEAIKEAYENASKINAKLLVLRDRENEMRKKRDDLERRLKGLEKTVEKAENVVSQLGVIKNFLAEGFQDLGETLENLQQKQELGLKIVKAQEEERRRVARDIHDGPAQGLANVVLRAEYCERLLDSDVTKVKQELAELKQMVRRSLQDVRKIIFDLRPMTLDDLGLVPALRRLISDIKEEEQIEIELVVFGEEKRMSRNLEVALFRIVQEALNNVKKHACASGIWTKVQFQDEKVLVNVRDDGKGFDPDKVLYRKYSSFENNNEANSSDKENNENKDSFGLQNIKDRVENLGGELTIKSKHNEGTTISVKVPLLAHEA
ncbi:sensor histidine kinase [Natranaerofaba carboxydovora]|uniref:sensor histidine kinase n=1 Tax=Natranaerofaba carboxydovora TaxID=2742683 RepID=UPI001F13AFAB|nr:sensor histidine kinase [Natranaerofaba carboxydovora]UMZ75044.1 Signal transduction histidine-protein kinase/phosphatase DegS [Natranaerofaba carboxydovora]